jgi:hypothetical protein
MYMLCIWICVYIPRKITSLHHTITSRGKEIEDEKCVYISVDIIYNIYTDSSM